MERSTDTIRPVARAVPRDRRVTLLDVAAAAGVGRTCASDILNRNITAKYTPDTRRRVQAAVMELGYVASRPAQLMARRRSGQVGLLLTRDFSNPYFARLADLVQREVRARGYRLQLVVTDGDPSTELESIRQMHAEDVEGLIVGPVYETLDLEQHRNILRGRLPVVLFGRTSGSEFDEITVDNDKAWQLPTRHLVEHGHNRIAVLCAPNSRTDRSDRSSFVAVRVLGDMGLLLPDWVVWHDDTGRYEDYFAASDAFAGRWLGSDPATRPTAVLCHNDQVATAALSAFHARGIRVPGDLSVVGHDNLPESGYLLPPLTTVDDRIDLQMAGAVDRLLVRISEPAAPRQVLTIEPRLVPRASVGTPGAGNVSTNHRKEAGLNVRTSS